MIVILSEAGSERDGESKDPELPNPATNATRYFSTREAIRDKSP
jgi:hypothetical protein